ncbi:MAG: sensor histidine kinase, partial [Deltaproteobacteria bacterium]
LAIVKRIVDGMGGSIEAVNNEYGGAIFTIRIPLSNSD